LKNGIYVFENMAIPVIIITIINIIIIINQLSIIYLNSARFFTALIRVGANEIIAQRTQTDCHRCHAHRVTWCGAIIAEDEFQPPPAHDPAGGIDLFRGHLDGVAIGDTEGRHAAIGIELPNADRRTLRRRAAPCRRRRQPSPTGQKRAAPEENAIHDKPLLTFLTLHNGDGERPGPGSDPDLFVTAQIQG
jgi:hypothetical protein